MKRRHDKLSLYPQLQPELPLELWQEIFSHLNFRVLFQCARICRSFDKYLLHKSVKRLEIPYGDTKEIESNVLFEELVNIQGLTNGVVIPEKILNSYRHLVTLDLSYANGVAPIGLEGLTGLKTLILSSDYAPKYIPPGLSCLTNLTSLDIRYYHYLSDDCISPLQNLVSLTISGFSGITSNCFLALTGLKRLSLYSINYKPDKKWQFPDSLEILSLDDAYKIGDSLMNLTNLTKLYVYWSDFDYNCISNMTKLTVLSLCQCHDADLSDGTLESLTQLTTLDIDTSVFVREECLGHLTNLRTLKIDLEQGDTEGYPLSSSFFSSLTNLTELELHDKFDLHEEDWRSLPNLKVLDIWDHPVTNKPWYYNDPTFHSLL